MARYYPYTTIWPQIRQYHPLVVSWFLRQTTHWLRLAEIDRLERRREYRHNPDYLTPEMIPKSASTTNWMLTDEEDGMSWYKKRKLHARRANLFG